MEHYAGLDVSVKETSVCVVDGAGQVVREVKVASEPGAILGVLADEAFTLKRIGLEAGPLSQWLYGALAEADLPVICVETRHMKAALSAQINKSDRNDARGITQMMRVGLYWPVHVKTLVGQKRRMLLTSRAQISLHQRIEMICGEEPEGSRGGFETSPHQERETPMACENYKNPTRNFLEDGSMLPPGDEQHRAVG